MRKNVKYHYFVEGKCEKKLVDELKKQQIPIVAGKINVFNVIQEELTDTRLRLISDKTIIILIFDTDTSEIEILKRNLKKLKQHPHVKETWCVMQVKKLEDELIRSTNINHIKELLGSKSNKDFKHDFIIEKNLYKKLLDHEFNYEKLWVTKPQKTYDGIDNAGIKIKTRIY